MTPTFVALGVLSAALIVPAGARAQPPSDSGETTPREQSSAVRMRFDDRPVFELGSAMRLELGGRVDADFVERPAASADREFKWGDRRLELAGELANRVRFELSGDVGASVGQRWRDAFVDVRATDALSVRGGRFKVPFSEERTRSAGRLDFVRRALATRVLAPGRDVGVMGRGRLFDRRLSVDVGLFDGRWSEWIEAEAGPAPRERHPLIAARVTARPFLRRQGPRGPLGSLRLGASWLQGRSGSGASGFELRSFSRDTPLTALPIGGTRSGLGFELQWETGPVRLAGEWIGLHDQRRGQALDGGDLRTLHSRGWYGSAVWRVLSPRRGGGAHGERRWPRTLDLAARIEALSIGTGRATAEAIVHPRADEMPWHTLRAATLGATVALTRWVRVQANAVVEDAAGAARPFVDGNRWGGLLRFQLAF